MLLPVPSTSAASHVADALWVEDSTGDVRLHLADEDASPPDDVLDHIDITGAWLGNEDLDSLSTGVGLGRLDSPDGSPRTISISFAIGDRLYRLTMAEGASCPAHLEARHDNGTGDEYLRCLEVERNEAEQEISVRMPKELLKNDAGVGLQPGQAVEKFHVVAKLTRPEIDAQLSAGCVCFNASDHAPNTGAAPAYFARHLGASGNGHLFLSTPTPIRGSNGEATTILFPVHLKNSLAIEEHVALETEAVPATFTVRMPETVHVPAGEEVQVPLILTMEFNHQHGVRETFTVRATSISSPEIFATLELGVKWFEIAQPAGHHSRLHLHSTVDADLPASARMWMNTLPPHEEAAANEKPVPPDGERTTMPASQPFHYDWAFPLSPSLNMGLNFDTELPASLQIVLNAPISAVAATLNVSLVYCHPGGDSVTPTTYSESSYRCSGNSRLSVLGSAQSPPGSLASGANSFEFELPLAPEVDRIPYRNQANLILFARLSTSNVMPPASSGNSVAIDVEQTELGLPLREYHDPVEGVFASRAGLKLGAKEPANIQINPGKRAVIEFEIANTGNDSYVVRASAEGINKEWAEILPRSDLRLGSSSITRLQVVLTAPEASPNDRADLFLVVEDLANPAITMAARIRAEVVDSPEIPDESHLVHAPPAKNVPFPAYLPLLAAALTLVRRLNKGESCSA